MGSVLKETDTIVKNPNDGEAWGWLGKAYKEIVRMPKGYLRADSVGREMFQLSREAYEKCLTLLPDDSLWHFGCADLLWSQSVFYIPTIANAEKTIITMAAPRMTSRASRWSSR